MAGVLQKVAVCGAGAMGSGIAQVAAQSGAHVRVFDVNADALALSHTRTTAEIEKLVSRGKLAKEEGADLLGRMEWVSKLDALSDRDLVVEAIIEDAAIKARLFAQVEDIVAPGAVIATNTSSIPVGRLARQLRHPDRFVGMHFFNPATVMKLVEVIPGPATPPSVVERVLAAAKSWGKVGIRVADVPGFIVNRVARPFYAEAFVAWNEGAATPATIDALFRGAGFRMGPLELTDLIGQDVNFAVARSVFDSYFGRTRFVPQVRQAALVDAGWYGRKTKRGVYDYSEGAATAEPEAALPPAIRQEHQEAARELETAAPGEFVRCGDTFIGTTRGLPAIDEARALNAPVALLDWSNGDGTGPIGYALSDESALDAVAGTLAAGAKVGCEVTDRPGLIVARTLAQIANAAADAVLEKVADESEIDSALRFGANYPFGPFAWAHQYGRAGLIKLLDAIAEGTGEAIYRPSYYLRNTA
ncbi:3-hydroxyacyl-CoA dehydrogenase NAD-binding domain-containing protein [Sphingomonas sp. ID0503]|uniref:3-hydroxyacyl-CoA dehydrogenase NAD-binding domain-containing protein n=1 Tax=Sphingomonas sp. ID0503 TaxID=3399691 RepID=UPI003AFAE86E